MHDKTASTIHAVGLLLAGLLSAGAMKLYGRENEIGERRNGKW